jgi:serine/threonine-protein kinase
VADLLTHLQSALADRYTLERELGRGGMATVYLARDLRHRRPVALKVLHPELAYALGADRFLREIEVAANLTHPHILPLFDSGEVEGLLYYVMPYVEGESLRERLRRETQLPVEDALGITREVADALAYAHGQGVIHRDIKPENILLYGGHALVADFGIARALWQAEGGRLTETGMAVGTAAYMSPEQATGERQVDGRSDVYSLGCVLYEMLAGEPPFTGPTVRAIMAKRLNDPAPRVRRVRPAVPESIEESLMHALAAVPADRFATAEQFAQTLSEPAARIVTARPSADARPAAAEPDRKSRTRGPTATALLLALLALAMIASLLRQRASGSAATDAPAPLRLAVLPFENLGDSADAYFADGVTDAVRGKLVTVPGLQVTARGSSRQYRQTTKSPGEIGRELEVQYLLTATVRWDKAPGGASRVQVTPELVDVASGSTRWQQPFDASLTSVFEVQSEIAGRVAGALNVALGDSAKQQLAERPTANLEAYDAYLKGEALSQGMGTSNPTTLRQAAAYYAQAVALDPGFVRAWAQLSAAHSTLYLISTSTPAEAEAAREAAERALTLAPNRVEGHLAMSAYYRRVTRDHARALQELELSERIAPLDGDLLRSAAFSEMNLGRWDAALAHFRQAQRLDPRSVNTARGLTMTLIRLRRYPEALEAGERAIALAPTDLGVIMDRAMIELAQGNLAGARGVLAAAVREVESPRLVAYFATYSDLAWVLDDAGQRLLLSLTPRAFDDNLGTWALVRAQTLWLRGDQAGARVYADSARLAMEQQLRNETGEDAELQALYGLSQAYLGNAAEALREGQRALATLPIARDAYNGPYIQHQLVRIHIVLGEADEALDRLEPLLKAPYLLSPGWLSIDPNFDPLRAHPRFQRLVSGR